MATIQTTISMEVFLFFWVQMRGKADGSAVVDNFFDNCDTRGGNNKSTPGDKHVTVSFLFV
jgi:hypothetical protein